MMSFFYSWVSLCAAEAAAKERLLLHTIGASTDIRLSSRCTAVVRYRQH